ncbi:MAG TPA: RNA polymerase sigma factor [Rubrivivax sp.]|nr:RNA polymerase sigma factor [Rubrivivax sp.]HPO18675.1 RNA polymerase sigma factor [Rubrivivax sp.]
MGVEQALGHIPALRRYARLLTGDATRADDLVQDTLERACIKWALWQPGSLLRSWLLSLMHNLHMNHVRDWRHDDGHAALDEAAQPSHDPTADLGRRLDLQQALAALPPPMREVLLLVGVEEYTYAEAAGILEVPVGTVMSRLHRARERLRELMADPARSAPCAPAAPLQLVKR